MKQIERQQLMQFSMGLNDAYQVVRSNVLMLNPLPSVSKASSMVLQEEQQREMRSSTHYTEIDSTAFLSHQRQQVFHTKSNPHFVSPTQQHTQSSHLSSFS